MLIIMVAGLLSWAIPRRVGWKWSLAAFFMVSLAVSSLVINDVQTAGVVRDDTGPEGDLVYSIVYYNSTALFPYVIQKHNNWTERTFVYYVLLLYHDGSVVSQTGPAPDQSEYMRWALFTIAVSLCFQGFIISILVILGVEFIIWWRKPNRMDILKGHSAESGIT